MAGAPIPYRYWLAREAMAAGVPSFLVSEGVASTLLAHPELDPEAPVDPETGDERDPARPIRRP